MLPFFNLTTPEFDQFVEKEREKHPQATETDVFNHVASIRSGGALPDPYESVDFQVRGEKLEQQKKEEREKELGQARRDAGLTPQAKSEKKGWSFL